MPSAGVLANRLLSAEYYFATLMDQVVDLSMQLEPVNEGFVCKVDELFYTIEALDFFVSRGIGTEDSVCMSVYNQLMEQIGINTTLPDLSVDTSLILVSPSNNINIYSGYELEDLHNVAISSPQNYDVLMYDSSTSVWRNEKNPRVITQAQRLALTPYIGMAVYQTNLTEGLYVYKSTGWTFIG
jgi:hypothetical protein